MTDFQRYKNRKTLAHSKAAAIASVRAAADHLLAAIPEIENGTITREADELADEVLTLLQPLVEFHAEELKPEHNPD